MANSNGDKSGEWTQIIILALAMTGGGFLVLYLVLQLFVLPGALSDVKKEIEDYRTLTKKLGDPEVKRLRWENEFKKEKDDKTLPLVMTEELERAGCRRRRGAKIKKGVAISMNSTPTTESFCIKIGSLAANQLPASGRGCVQ